MILIQNTLLGGRFKPFSYVFGAYGCVFF